MLIDFNAKMTELDGTEVKEVPGSDKVLTLAKVATTALTTMLDTDKNLPGDEKFALGVLAHEVHQGGEVDLSVEDIAKLKTRIGKLYGPLLVMQSYNLLDPKA